MYIPLFIFMTVIGNYHRVRIQLDGTSYNESNPIYRLTRLTSSSSANISSSSSISQQLYLNFYMNSLHDYPTVCPVVLLSYGISEICTTTTTNSSNNNSCKCNMKLWQLYHHILQQSPSILDELEYSKMLMDILSYDIPLSIQLSVNLLAMKVYRNHTGSMYGVITSLEEDIQTYLNTNITTDFEYLKSLNLRYIDNNMILLLSLCNHCTEKLERKYSSFRNEFIENLMSKSAMGAIDTPPTATSSTTTNNVNSGHVPITEELNEKTDNICNNNRNSSNNSNNNNNALLSTSNKSNSSKVVNGSSKDPIAGSHPFWRMSSTPKNTGKSKGSSSSFNNYRQSLPAFTEKDNFIQLLQCNQVSVHVVN